MLKEGLNNLCGCISALLAKKYIEIARMAGHCRADVSSAKISSAQSGFE
jgi:hypothetical protein